MLSGPIVPGGPLVALSVVVLNDAVVDSEAVLNEIVSATVEDADVVAETVRLDAAVLPTTVASRVTAEDGVLLVSAVLAAADELTVPVVGEWLLAALTLVLSAVVVVVVATLAVTLLVDSALTKVESVAAVCARTILAVVSAVVVLSDAVVDDTTAVVEASLAAVVVDVEAADVEVAAFEAEAVEVSTMEEKAEVDSTELVEYVDSAALALAKAVEPVEVSVA